MHLISPQMFISTHVPTPEQAKYEEFCQSLCTCCCFFRQNWKLVPLAVARRAAENAAHHGGGWRLGGNNHKGISAVAVPLLSMSVSVTNLFCSPSFSICLHLAPTGEGQSIDLLSPLPESAVKSAQAPPLLPRLQALLLHCVAWLLASVSGEGPAQASQGPHRKKKPQPHEGLRDSAAAQCSCVWIADVVGPLPPTEGFFSLCVLQRNNTSL